MKKFIAKITISFRPSILDVQGRTITKSLENLNFNQINSARVGKYIELDISADNALGAELLAQSACKKLLANPIMENYTIEIVST